MTLRPARWSDLGLIMRWRNHDLPREAMRTHPTTEEWMDRWYLMQKLAYMIALIQVLIGMVSCSRSGEVSIFIAPESARGRGHGLDALNQFMALATAEGIDYLWAETDKPNLFRKAGFIDGERQRNLEWATNCDHGLKVYGPGQ